MSLIALVSGCVLSVHDPKIEDLRPAVVSLNDFAGVYLDQAKYHTAPNMIGLEGDETLGGALAGLYFHSNVTIEVTSAGDIAVKADGGAYGPIVLRYVQGKDFAFKDHAVVFASHRVSGTSEVAIGTYKTSMVWMLSDAKELVVIKRDGGAGLGILVIPIVSSGATFSIFERVPTAADISP